MGLIAKTVVEVPMGVTLQEVVPLPQTNCTPENLIHPDSASKNSKSHSRPSSGSRSRPSSGSRSRPSSAKRNKDSKHFSNHGKDRHFDDNGKNGAEDELVLPALPAVGEDVAANVIQRTADFLKSRNKNRGGILHSTSGNVRPVSANNHMNEDEIVFSKRRTKRLHSLDKENISAHKINRAKVLPVVEDKTAIKT